MWDENRPVRRHHHHHQGTKKSGKGIHVTFFVFHAIATLLGIGLFVIAYTAQAEEKNIMGEIKLGVTTTMALIHNICGGALILAVVVGLLAQFFRKTFLFLIYCVLMSMIALAQFSAAGTSFGHMAAHEFVIQKLKELIMEYGNHNHKNSAEMTLAWDSLQQKYKCCGVNSYTDWQSVDYGLTSLKVPMSCCIKERVAALKEEGMYCGQNMLPDNHNAAEFIHVNGCQGKIMNQLDRQLFILGVFGIVVAIFNVITIIFACFLVITKRV